MTTEKRNRLDALANINIVGKKPIWRKVGVAFPLKNRAGYSLKLELLPIPSSGAFEFILVEPNTKEAEKE